MENPIVLISPTRFRNRTDVIDFRKYLKTDTEIQFADKLYVRILKNHRKQLCLFHH